MMHLACIAELGYARHAGAMLHSALGAAAKSDVHVYVLHSEMLADEDQSSLRTVVEGLGGRLRFIEIAAENVADLPAGYFPRAVWLRILLPELLPELDRVLYLDSDLIVTDDLGPLWEVDLDDFLLGAVTNPFYSYMSPHPETLGISDPADYLNSGVLLMNLQLMREEETSRKLREYAAAHPGDGYPDQDALNAVCRDRWLHLHPRWNVQTTLYEESAEALPFDPVVVAEALEHPAVIHFIGPFKPWQHMCRHPHQSLYFRHAAATPWGAPAIEGRTLRTALLRQLPLAWIDRVMTWERASAPLVHRLRGRLGTTARRATGRGQGGLQRRR